jgi:hypothetical protein
MGHGKIGLFQPVLLLWPVMLLWPASFLYPESNRINAFFGATAADRWFAKCVFGRGCPLSLQGRITARPNYVLDALALMSRHDDKTEEMGEVLGYVLWECLEMLRLWYNGWLGARIC